MKSSNQPVAFDGRVPYPDFASIETTMKCNLQCPMCLPFLDGSTVAGRHMDVEAFETPDTLWSRVPPGSTCEWRGLAVFADRLMLVARGTLVREG